MSTENYTGKEPIGSFNSLQTYLTYSWINNEYFYSLVPAAYKDFYMRFVKHWFYWYDGFVPYFHNSQSGMISTRLAYTIIKKLAEKTVGGHLMYDDEGEIDEHEIKINGKSLNSLNFVEHWSHENDFTSLLELAFNYAYAGGDSILKLDSDGKDLIPTTMRKDTYYFDTDFRGKICKFLGLIYAYTKLVPEQGNDHSQKQYYLVEEREYQDGKPKFRVAIKVSQAGITNNKPFDITIEEVPFSRLPRDVSHKFKKDFPNIDLGKWYDIPLEDLGIYQIKASKGLSFLPDLPYGESLLSNLIHILMTYDFYFSSLTTNLYTTRDKVIMPQHMQTPQDPSYLNYDSGYNQGLDKFMFTAVPYVNPEDQKPIFIQPEIRDWNMVRNNLLQTCAMSLGVDERTIMSSIVPNAEKPTAREISVDEDTTSSFVEAKRELNRGSLNKLFEQVIKFYGFATEKITVRFSKAGLSNMTNNVTITTLLKQNGLGDLKTLLEMIYVDKNEKQIQNIFDAIKEEEEVAFERSQKQQEQKDTQGVEEKIEQKQTVTEHQVPKNKGKD